jgi:hypothetical protein
MLNYFVSAEAEAIALTPKAPFIAAEGQIEGHERNGTRPTRAALRPALQPGHRHIRPVPPSASWRRRTSRPSPTRACRPRTT